MKLDNEMILQFFSLFTDLPDAELSKWRGLCGNAGAKVYGLRKKGVDIKRNMERLCSAAAACAYCDYILLSGGGRSADEVRVGDITVRGIDRNDMLDAADTREHFLRDVADLIDVSTGFAVTVSECEL